MNSLRIALVLLLLPASAMGRQNAGSGASVEGVVVDRVTGSALPGIVVELTGIVATNVETYASTTDKNGKFILKNVLAGPGYWLTASPPRNDRSHMRTVYGQRGLTGPGSQIAIQTNLQMKDVRLALIPTGTISGRVVNEKGKPVANKNVTAVSPSFAGGPWAHDFNDISTGIRLVAMTNGRGEYRIAGLPPGQYFVSVNGNSNLMMKASEMLPIGIRPDNESEGYYASTFFPGTTDPYAASSVDLRAGVSVSDVNMAIAPVRYRRVRGVVIDDATGNRVTTAELLMVPRNVAPDSTYTRSLDANKGSFEIDSVFRGSYFIVAYVDEPGRMQIGRVSIEVGRDHLESVTIRVGPGFDVTGRIVVEREDGSVDSNVGKVRVTLRPKPPSEAGILEGPTKPSFKVDQGSTIGPASVHDNGMKRSAVAIPEAVSNPDSDGRLRFSRVSPWDYTVEVTTEPEEYYVKSIHLGNLDVIKDGLRIDSPSSESLAVVLGSSAGRLEGRVSGDASDPVDNIRVILVPSGALQNRADLLKTAWTDASGKFQMGQIAPGDYTLYAWEFVEDGAWRDPEFLRLFDGKGTPVHIRERTTERIEMRIIPPWF